MILLSDWRVVLCFLHFNICMWVSQIARLSSGLVRRLGCAVSRMVFCSPLLDHWQVGLNGLSLEVWVISIPYLSLDYLKLKNLALAEFCVTLVDRFFLKSDADSRMLRVILASFPNLVPNESRVLRHRQRHAVVQFLAWVYSKLSWLALFVQFWAVDKACFPLTGIRLLVHAYCIRVDIWMGVWTSIWVRAPPVTLWAVLILALLVLDMD